MIPRANPTALQKAEDELRHARHESNQVSTAFHLAGYNLRKAQEDYRIALANTLWDRKALRFFGNDEGDKKS